MKHADLQITGMTCNHCVMALREELMKLQGVILDDIGIGSAKVDYDESRISRKVIEDAVGAAGYAVGSWRQTA
jgi:copper chaperone